MKASFTALWCLLSLAAGCGRRVAPDVAHEPDEVARPDAPAVGVAWVPSLVEDGSMFRDESAFRSYLEGSEVVVVGILTSWDGRDGRLRVERVLRGRADAELTFRGSGGFVRPGSGSRVIALLSMSDGGFALHSFCAAGGAYAYTDSLAGYLEETLRDRPL